jgi:hypothetical protein
VVVGNPPFSGRGLKDVLRLAQPTAAKAARRERSLFGDEPGGSPAKAAGEAGSPAGRHELAILDSAVRQLSRYACWRLRGGSDESADAGIDEADSGSLFADIDLSGDRPMRASDYERMAQAVADWPADRLLDRAQPGTRETIRRIASTAIEVFFTERFVQLAKPGGLLAMIVPESILASDQLAPLRKWLMEKIQLLAVVGLPQKVFTGVGAKAKTGIIFARRYTPDQEKANAKADAPAGIARLAPELREERVIMVSPNTDAAEWTLQEYLTGVLERAKKPEPPKGAQT